MPLREYECQDCLKVMTELVRNKDDEPTQCPDCNSPNIKCLISAFGGYVGNMGGGSTRPKHSGSFAGRKKK